MAKITRYNGNLQAPASAAIGTERTIFGDVTQSDDLTTNFTVDLLRGWGIVGPNDTPSLEDFNAMAFTLGQLLAYLHQMGVAEYNVTQEYHTGSTCSYSGALYVSTTDSNVGNTPGTGGDWEKVPTLDTAHTWTASQTLSVSGGSTDLLLDSAAGSTSTLQLKEDGVNRFIMQHDPVTNVTNLQQYNGAGATIVGRVRFFGTGDIDVTAGTLKYGGSEVLVDNDIGDSVQAHDPATAKTDVAADFTAGLKSGGSEVLTNNDIGDSVQAYDVATAKKDINNNFSVSQDIDVSSGTATLVVDSGPSSDSRIYLREDGVNRTVLAYDTSAGRGSLTQSDAAGTAVAAEIRLTESGDVDVATGTLKAGGVAVTTADDIGSTIQAFDDDTTKNDVANIFTEDQTIQKSTAVMGLQTNSGTGSAQLYFQDSTATLRAKLYWAASQDVMYLRKYDTNGSTIKGSFRFDNTGIINVDYGTLQYGGVEVATVDDVPDKISFHATTTSNHSGVGSGFLVLNSANFSSLSEDFDNGSHFTLSTGRFQPTVAGYYQLNASIAGDSITDGNRFYVYIYRNGVIKAADGTDANSGTEAHASCSTVVYLDGSTDYVEARIYCQDTSWVLDASGTQFSGHLVHT